MTPTGMAVEPTAPAKGKRRGRKPKRKNEKFRPPVLPNGDTTVELLTRCWCALTQTPDKWSENMKARMKLLFELYIPGSKRPMTWSIN